MALERLTGRIDFETAAALPAGAKIHVELLDTTRMDMPAETVAEVVLDNGANAQPVKSLAFELLAEIKDTSHDYTVNVTVDVNSKDGEGLHEGDYINTQSYPVLTRGNPSNVAVRVQKI